MDPLAKEVPYPWKGIISEIISHNCMKPVKIKDRLFWHSSQ